jgi:FAD synthetase
MRIPYCNLYDQGYTSLGGRLDTHPNPALRIVNDAGEVEYRPAYELVGEQAERLGRD